jgi:copper(I)-binding protein
VRHRWTIAAALLCVGACSRSPAPAASDAWVRLAAVPGRPAAAYFTLHGGTADAVLAQISAPGIKRIELHESRMTAAGTMAMDALASVPVPAGSTVPFAPAGRHAMLFDVPAGVVAGSMLPLTLRFADGAAVEVPAQVIAAGDAAPK